MKSDSLQYQSKSPNLRKHELVQGIIQLIVENIKNKPMYETLNVSVDLVLEICQSIENLVYENKLDFKGSPKAKLDMALQVYTKLNWNQNIDFLCKTIEYLHSTGQIKRVGFWKRFFGTIKNLFFKKFLD